MDMIDGYDAEDWKRHFRMTSSTFHQLLDIIGPAIKRKNIGSRYCHELFSIVSISVLQLDKHKAYTFNYKHK